MRAWASLAGLPGSVWPRRASLADSDRSLEVPRAPKVERQGRPGEPDKPFATIWGRCWLASVFDAFRSFLTCHGAGDSTCCAQGRTFVFAGRRTTLEGSQARQKNAKSRKLDRTLLGRRFASEPRARSSPFSIPCASQPRFSSPRRAPRRSKALLLVPRGDLGDPLGAAGTFRERPDMLPRRTWGALGALLGANGVPGWLPLA